MFSYIPKSIWFPTSVDVKQAATIEELLKLCKAGDVERVIIPMTYYGYGASLADDSNRRSIERHYRKSRFKSYGYSLTMSAPQFVRNEDYREMVRSLVEDYIIFDEQDYSNLETETKEDHIVSELVYALNESETDNLWTAEEVSEVLNAGDWSDRIEWWEYVEIDNDGATPYANKEDVATLAELVKAKRAGTK